MRYRQSLILCAALLAGAAQPQTLERRKPAAGGEPLPADANATGDARQALPVAAEGEYRWGETGEVIELYLENGSLHGYMTRRSERQSAGSAPMTFAFAEATVEGTTLKFTTRHVHGDWYSFVGRVARGTEASAHREGYYLLQGTLSTHLGPAAPGDESASDAPLTRQVSLKLAAGRHTAD